MDFSVWLRQYRKRRGLSQAQLAEWLNRQSVLARQVDKYTVGNWEQARSLPDYKTCLAVGYCAGLADPYATFLEVPHGYRLNEEGHRRLDEYARLLESSPRYALARPAPAGRVLRFYDIPVSAGFGQFLDSDDYELRPVEDWVPGEADFAVRVAGDSMEPRFVDRQWIFVKEQPTLEEGELGVFRYDGEAYCKQLGRGPDGTPALLSLNPKYAPIPLLLEEAFAVLGKVVS